MLGSQLPASTEYRCLVDISRRVEEEARLLTFLAGTVPVPKGPPYKVSVDQSENLRGAFQG